MGLCKKTYYGMLTELAKGGEKKDRGGARGTRRKTGRSGAHRWAGSGPLPLHYICPVCVCVCTCRHLSRTHASLRALLGPKSVQGWASAARSSEPQVPQTSKTLRLIFKKNPLYRLLMGIVT